MKKPDANVAHGKLAMSQPSNGDKLDAPIRLTPAQLESVAAGFVNLARLPTGLDPTTGPLTTTGAAQRSK
jgi:hypothetical protein